MKIFITGGTGFVGTNLCRQFAALGYKITVLANKMPLTGSRVNGVDYIKGDSAVKGRWQSHVPDHDIIINLAGASIFTRWTKKQKEIIRSSRIETTRNLVDSLPSNSRRITLFSTSAVGYYGFREEELTEASSAGNDFLANVSGDWEAEAFNAQDKGARVIVTRFGIVLGKSGGALGLMIPLYKYFLGGPLGSGQQWFSWIHMRDLVSAFLFLINKSNVSGIFNFCSPNPLRNFELARAIGKILHRPSFIRTPGFLIKSILGEFGSMLLNGQRVIPEGLLNHGFTFQYPYIENALKEIISG